MKFLFGFSAVYFSYMLGCIADPVKTMTDLLSCSGWLELVDENTGLEIIDHQQGTDQPDRQLHWNRFTAIEVTEENLAEKIRLTYQFMSCTYARVLIDLSDFERGMGAQCRNLDKTFDCLEDYVRTIKHKHPVVSRMIGALSSLQGLSSTQTLFENDVFDILKEMRNYYQQKTVDRPAGDDHLITKGFADQECIAVENHAHLMSKRLFGFYNSFCSPPSYYDTEHECSGAMHFVNMLLEYAPNCDDDTHVIGIIKGELEITTTNFTKWHDNQSGFEYDPERDTTRIITYDPETEARVAELNRVLANDKWKSLDLSIRERSCPYLTPVGHLLENYGSGQGGNAIVTRENVYYKLKLAHLFLSCKYAYILKKCCGHTASMWTDCKESQDPVCLDKFLEILNKNDPLVMRMVDALSYIQNISPNTAYNNGVYDSLVSFQSIYNHRTAWPLNTRNVESWSSEIEKEISEITQSTDEFHSVFCHPSNNSFASYDGENVTIDDKGETFINDVETDTSLFAIM